METVLVCISPDIPAHDYEFLEAQLKGRGWDARLADVTTLAAVEVEGISAAMAYAADWPEARLEDWLRGARAAIGPRRRLLAVLPHPPESYPAETQALWSRAVGYGTKISVLIEIVNGFLAGRA
jgi:hypothetical protein